MNRRERALTFFNTLGEAVANGWRDAHYSDGALPVIAERILIEHSPHKSISSHDIIEWALTSRTFLDGPRSEHGQAPLTVYRGKRFHIEVGFSVGASTTIHGHDFEGAFCVLGGSSIHTQYSFVEEKRLSSRLLLGDLRFNAAELTEPGVVHQLRASAESIHALFHLESPTVTIVIRTARTHGLPHYTYRPPYLAIASADVDPQALRTIELLGILRQTGSSSLAEIVSRSVENTDDLGAYEIFNTLNHWNLEIEDALTDAPASEVEPSADIDRVREAYAASRHAVARMFGEDAIALFQVSRLEFLTGQAVAMRHSIKNDEHRFFVALLMNVPSRSDLLRLVSSRYPGDPVQTVMRWLRDLTKEQFIPFEIGGDTFAVLESDLRGVPPKEHLSRIHARPLTASEVAEVESTLDLLKSVAIFRPLFENEAWAPFASLRSAQSSA